MIGFGTHLIITSVKGKIDLEIVDAEVPAALALCLIRLNNRTVSAATDDTTQDRRRISKQVSNAVWIRDGGTCVECGAKDYLEFDHVIPVSKGGSNTVQNVQLLCRRCNSKKSDKI
jgi:5-methylcytosine-specific restriction endonuclease McrA